MKIVECPRDAMQGLPSFIPTADKVRYINKLLKVGFDTIDFGSFVSPKAIPQMRDTHEVLGQLDLKDTRSRLLAIVANLRGAEEAAGHESITYLGFPLSVSETFQKRNTNKSIVDAINEVEQIQNICQRSSKTLVTYISMGFGNPYGDPYDEEIVVRFADILITLGVGIISLADTIGAATPDHIGRLYHQLSSGYPQAAFGAHLHATPSTAIEKISAAFEAGCRRMDGAILGYGGCPMADDELVGNLPTEAIVSFVESQGMTTGLNSDVFNEATRIAREIFPH